MWDELIKHPFVHACKFKCSDRVKVVNEYSFQHTGYSKEWIIAFGVVTLLLTVSVSISIVTCIRSFCVKKKRKTNLGTQQIPKVNIT